MKVQEIIFPIHIRHGIFKPQNLVIPLLFNKFTCLVKSILSLSIHYLPVSNKEHWNFNIFKFPNLNRISPYNRIRALRYCLCLTRLFITWFSKGRVKKNFKTIMENSIIGGGQQGSFPHYFFFVPNDLKINFRHWNFFHV